MIPATETGKPPSKPKPEGSGENHDGLRYGCITVMLFYFLAHSWGWPAGRATALWLLYIILYPVTWRVVQWTRCILPCWVGSEFREVWQALPLRPQIVRHKARCQRFQWDLVVQWTHGFVWNMMGTPPNLFSGTPTCNWIFQAVATSMKRQFQKGVQEGFQHGCCYGMRLFPSAWDICSRH